MLWEDLGHHEGLRFSRRSLAKVFRAGPAGDLNADGVVDLLDVLVVLDGLGGLEGEVAGALAGDVNGDGVVGIEDVGAMLALVANGGSSATSGMLGGEDELPPDDGDLPGLLPTACCIDRVCIIDGQAVPCSKGEPLPDDGGGGGGCTPVDSDQCRDDDNDGIRNRDDCDSPFYTGDPADCDDDGDGIPNRDDCDSQYYEGDPATDCECQDSDGDGIINQDDCDSPCYNGDPSTDCACQDDDGDGIRNQHDCDSNCYQGESDPEIRLRLDVNEDGVINDSDDDLKGTAPGRTILTNTLDQDFDGWPDFADGYNLVDVPEFTSDDAGAGEFIPVELDVSEAGGESASVTFTYSASDPSEASVIGGWITGSGALRIWRRGAASRDKRDAKDGGDYVAAGTQYSLEELGLEGCGSSVTLYVESVRASQGPGDQTVVVTLDSPNGRPSDEVVFTSVQVQFLSRMADATEWRLAPVLVASQLYDLNDPPEPEEIAASYIPSLHVVRIWDPRGSAGYFMIGLEGLELTPTAGGCFESDVFWLDEPPFFSEPGGAPDPSVARRVPIGGEDIEWSYNPHGNMKRIKLPRATRDEAVLQKALDDVVAAMEQDAQLTWRANYAPNDTGAYGKEVHLRVSQRMQNREGWYSSIYWDTETRRVLSIGTPPPGGTSATTMEMDLICMKKGRQLSVGDLFDWANVEGVHEIKTSITGRASTGQKQKYIAICQSEEWSIQNPLRRYSDSEGWVDHARGKRLRAIGHLLVGVSAASTVLAVAFPENLEARADDVIAKYDQLQYDIDDPYQGPVSAHDFGVSLGEFITARTGQDYTAMTGYISTYVYLYYQDELH